MDDACREDTLLYSPLLEELAVAVDALGGVCRGENMSQLLCNHQPATVFVAVVYHTVVNCPSISAFN